MEFSSGEAATDMSTAGTVLVVDDTPANLDVVSVILERCDYTLLVATEGQRALRICQQTTPDLILLDVMMPGMDGYEVCERLKADAATQDIPVIFMTALNSVDDKLRGFAVGGADYITKPIQREELVARVKAHVSLSQNYRILRDRNESLARMNAELDAFAHTVAHDLKNPLNSVLGLSQLLAELASESGSALQITEFAQHIRISAQKMRQIIEALLLLAGVNRQSVAITPVAMDKLLDELLDSRLRHTVASFDGELKRPESLPMARAYGPWVEEIWANYLSNALKYGGRPPRLVIGAEIRGTRVRYWVDDNGAGVDEAAREKLFTPFARLHQVPGQEGHGLGLSIVQRICQRLKGDCGMENLPGRGSRFYFELPAVS